MDTYGILNLHPWFVEKSYLDYMIWFPMVVVRSGRKFYQKSLTDTRKEFTYDSTINVFQKVSRWKTRFILYKNGPTQRRLIWEPKENQDGGVRKTVNIDLAFNKGADLVICYNPFKPYNNELFLEYLREDNKYITKNERISDLGLGSVLNQVLRPLFHSRLQNSLEFLAKDPDFTKDLIVIEPDENDDDHFMMNPLFHWTRAKAAKLGFDSVKEAINKDYDKVEKILNSYGITMTSEVVDGEAQKINHSYYDDRAIMETLENPRKKKKLKVIKGGKN